MFVGIGYIVLLAWSITLDNILTNIMIILSIIIVTTWICTPLVLVIIDTIKYFKIKREETDSIEKDIKECD